MQRSSAVATALVAVALGLVGPSCAQGNSSPGRELSDTSPVTDADAGPNAACPPCGPNQKCSAGACTLVTVDADGDGYPLSNDCDDHDRTVHPGAVEVCNGKDDNCDGRIDEGFDVDGDGYVTCALPGRAADCNDSDPAVHPGAVEICNGKDDNCDGRIDEGFDKDNDGYYSCVHATLAVDCDDNDPKVHPGAAEICDGKDNDCNGKIDDIPATLTGSLAAPVNSHWAIAGSTSISNGWAQLTPDVAYQSGALWWNAPYTFDTFDMTGTFWIQNKVDGADGMAFAWIAGNNVAVAGNGGALLGIGSLTGYAVIIDTFQNAGEPVAPFLGIAQVAGGTPMTLARATIPNVRDGLNHRLRVRLDSAKVSVWIDGINYFNDYVIAGYVPVTGHWGFTAGTGGATEAHWVQDVAMSFPNGQGCVP